MKNTFISLLLALQNKREQYSAEKKKRGPPRSPHASETSEPKYLTTVILFQSEYGQPDNQTLQILIKILKAINKDSPTVY
ncbi:unnamed protein product [Leptidea sinapis]|uniref:Uncharacterized protein n=1 Tax=Leptidea sinapis TaxID=189913 RepID=A0A5E4QTN1_9NEOP|nr:unnamed protein product [Leptidea sinapis]